MAKIPEYPPIRTGDLQKDYDNLREYLVRMILDRYQTELAAEKTATKTEAQNASMAAALSNCASKDEFRTEGWVRKITLQSDHFRGVSLDVTVPGYTAWGVIGRRFSVDGLCSLDDYIEPPGRLWVGIWNNSGGDVTDANIAFQVLYKKDDAT